jgi:hypothetical protein
MVVDGLYFNMLQRAPLWYTPSGNTTVLEVKYVLWTGLQLQPINTTNAHGRRPSGYQLWTTNQSWRKPLSVTGWNTRRTMYRRVMKIVRRARRVSQRASSK